MLPITLLHETAVRESGETPVVALGEHASEDLQVSLSITHAIEHESIDVDILASDDGRLWRRTPAISFAQKFYCGTYHLVLPSNSGRFIKAAWRVSRWGREQSRPFFRLNIAAETLRVRAMAGAA